MPRTLIRQDDQIRESEVYDDTIAAGSGLEAVLGLEADLNALRSQQKRFLNADNAGDWFEDIDTVTGLGAPKKRGLQQIAVEVDALEEKRLLFRTSLVQDISVPAAQNYVVLGAGEFPTVQGSTAAVGAVATKGTVVAAATSFGAHNLDEVTGPDALSPKNLCLILSATTGNRILSNGKEVFALIQTENATDGHTMSDTTPNRVQLSFVRANAGDTDLEAVPVADIQGQDVRYAFNQRLDFDNLPETAFLGGFTDNTGAAGATTLDTAVDNQIGNVTQQLKNITWLIDDNFRFAFRDQGDTVDIWAVKPAAAGDEVEYNVNLLDINNTVPVDIAQGLSVDTVDQAINIGVTQGQIDSAGGLDILSGGGGNLRLEAALELFLDDVNQTGSTWAQTNGIKLSEDTAEWDAFEVAFGEVSLLNAIVQASAASGRTKGVAVVTGNIAPDVNVTGVGGGANLDVQLPDYSSVTFLDDVDVYVNGVLQRNGANAAANNDVYPGDVPANGDLKFEYRLRFRGGSNPDVITMIVYGA